MASQDVREAIARKTAWHLGLEVDPERVDFYAELVEFMTSGAVMPVALERDDAVARLREVIGATDPAEAAEGTVRKLFNQPAHPYTQSLLQAATAVGRL